MRCVDSPTACRERSNDASYGRLRDRIDTVNEAERLARELDATMSGDPWYGTAVSRILDGVDAGKAAARPFESGHSIWELVLHMTAWVSEVKRRLDGGMHGEPLEGDWPAVGATTPAAWADAVSELRSAHADLSRTLTAREFE